MVNSSVGSVRDFYEDANILVTGGTGFLGQALVEHLLRKTDINSIYLIIRAKKGQSIEERTKNYFNNDLFTLLKEQKINALDKVKFIFGDVQQENLGLSEEDRMFLVENTNIVFHSAATIQFNENLKNSILMNVGGTKAMLDLAENMKYLKAFMHVSTAFVHGNLKEYFNCSEEKVMSKNGDLGPLEILELGKCINEYISNIITPALTENTMNTYLFTKRAAEALVKTYEHLPIGIFRPALIFSANSEPIPGWINTIIGPSGLVIARGSGLMHLVLSKSNYSCDAVPVDMSVNCLIASAWDVHNRQNGLHKGEMKIYNYVSSPDNPDMTWKKLQFDFQAAFDKYPPVNRFWHSYLINVSNPTIYMFLSVLLQYIPALIYDKTTSFMGQKPSMVRTVEKLNQIIYYTDHLTCKNWKYINDNVNDLWNRMNSIDKSLFPFSLKNFDWDSYINNYIHGIHTYLLKTPSNRFQEARRTAWIYFLLHWCIISSLGVFCFSKL